MQIQFVIGNEIKYQTRLNMTRDELFKDNLVSSFNQKQKFKIPINKVQIPVQSFSKKKRFVDEAEDEEESSYTSDSFDAMEDEDEIGNNSIKSDDMSASDKKLLRKYKNESFPDMSAYSEFTGYTGLQNNKKQKKDLTEDDILKRNDQILKRKLHAKKMLEEEKRQTIEKILNEDGRKLRERQKKLNEEAAKKEQQAEESFKISLTKIKLKHQKDGKIFLRFPQGLLLPKVLLQKSSSSSSCLITPQKCGVLSCSNIKKYKDPKTKINYCSVNCYRILKNSNY